ncbi:MAG: aromatic ring-hydroxylating dioxygenase subunit alpha [Trueperaceae bacterium]|nr:aromatic ring-hydroxylating dioxygenase subunit alpha [Trueperaceae bacterium]
MIDDPVLVNDWHPLASVKMLEQKPVFGSRLLGEDIVIWKDQGHYYAWQDLCIHRGAKLSLGKIKDNCLMCPYHGWYYDKDGKCIFIPTHPEQTPPAKALVKTYLVTEAYGLLWVCLGQPEKEVPPFPEWPNSQMAKAVCGPYEHLKAHGPRLIENYLDAAHFPFVHENVLGDPDKPMLGEFEVRQTSEGIASDPIRVYQPNPYGDSAGEVTYTYHAFRPLTAHFTKHMKGATNGMMLTVTPHDELDSTAWFVVATTAMKDTEALAADYEPRIRAIFEEDRAIVESQRPELLPLDLQAELHLRSDRVAIAYRKWLRELGLKFGTA